MVIINYLTGAKVVRLHNMGYSQIWGFLHPPLSVKFALTLAVPSFCIYKVKGGTVAHASLFYRVKLRIPTVSQALEFSVALALSAPAGRALREDSAA